MQATPWLSLAEAAAYVQRGRRFLAREVRAGRLRAARIGGRGELLTCVSWLDAWVESQATPLTFRSRGHG